MKTLPGNSPFRYIRCTKTTSIHTLTYSYIDRNSKQAQKNDYLIIHDLDINHRQSYISFVPYRIRLSCDNISIYVYEFFLAINLGSCWILNVVYTISLRYTL